MTTTVVVTATISVTVKRGHPDNQTLDVIKKEAWDRATGVLVDLNKSLGDAKDPVKISGVELSHITLEDP